MCWVKNSNYLAGLPDAIKVFKIIDKIIKMILTRSPLRISLGGGGTDLIFYEKYGGYVVLQQ